MMEYKGVVPWGESPKNPMPDQMYLSFKEDEYGNKDCYIWINDKWVMKSNEKGEK
jgi:hypothetical protein